MIKYDTCIRCNSKNVELLKVNSSLNLNSVPKKDWLGGVTKMVYNPTDAILCKCCGHVELFLDLDDIVKK